jgi:hypothetical protein
VVERIILERRLLFPSLHSDFAHTQTLNPPDFFFLFHFIFFISYF